MKISWFWKVFMYIYMNLSYEHVMFICRALDYFPTYIVPNFTHTVLYKDMVISFLDFGGFFLVAFISLQLTKSCCWFSWNETSLMSLWSTCSVYDKVIKWNDILWNELIQDDWVRYWLWFDWRIVTVVTSAVRCIEHMIFYFQWPTLMHFGR